MARARTSEDVFNAIGDVGRRRILDALARQELTVASLSARLGLSQPQASKHLRVLRDVGAVHVRRQGRERHYRANVAALRPVHAWSGELLETWERRFERLDTIAQTLDDPRGDP